MDMLCNSSVNSLWEKCIYYAFCATERGPCVYIMVDILFDIHL